MINNIPPEKAAHLANQTPYKLKAATLVHALHRRCDGPDPWLIFMDNRNREQRFSPGEIRDRSANAARILVHDGLRPGETVVIILPNTVDFVAAFFGTLMAGAIPVPVGLPAGTTGLETFFRNLRHILDDSRAAFLLADNRIKPVVGAALKGNAGIRKILFAGELRRPNAVRPCDMVFAKAAPEDIAMIQYTSGTTGAPKGVMLSHANLLHNVHGFGAAIGTNGADVCVSWLPLYHDMGLIGTLMGTMYWNLPLVLMLPESFLFNPRYWLENIGRYRGTITVSPNFGYQYCIRRIAEDVLASLDLSSLRVAINGAEHVDMSTQDHFIERFGPCGLRDDIFLPSYGMAENCLAATMPRLNARPVVLQADREALEQKGVVRADGSGPARDTISLVSVGRPNLGQQIRIADSAARTLSQGRVGEVLVKSPSLTAGYFGNRAASERALKDGWLHTGDLGFVQDDRLFITGRAKEIIIKRGRNYYPYDLERICQTVPGIRLGCCAAFDVPNPDDGTESLVMVCETKAADPEERKRLARVVNAELVTNLGVSADHVLTVPPGTIPKTSSGKIKRAECRARYLKGRLMPRPTGGLFYTIRIAAVSCYHFVKYSFFRRRPFGDTFDLEGNLQARHDQPKRTFRCQGGDFGS